MTRYERAYSDLTALGLPDHVAYLRDLKASHDSLQDQLTRALPYVEEACAHGGYKIGTEKKVTDAIHAALKAAEALR